MKKHWPCLSALLLVLLVVAPACRRLAQPEYNAEALLFIAVLLPPDAKPVKAEAAALAELLPGLAERWPAWAEAVREAGRLLAKQGPAVRLETVGPDQLRFPEPKYLAEFGVGFQQPDVLRCASSGKAIQLVFTCDSGASGRAYAAIQALSLALAEASRGYVYDVNSKLIFTPEAYGASLFSAEAFELIRHVSVQQYNYQPGHLRLVTLGMAKFGCPELEMRDFPMEQALVCRQLVEAASARLIADHLAEPGVKALPAELQIGLDSLWMIRRPVALTGFRKVKPPTTKMALLTGEADEGDPQENVVRLGPPAGFTGEANAWVAGVAREYMGFEEKLDYAPSAEIPAEIRQRFQETFPRFKEVFGRPHQPGERFYVKFRYELEGAGVEMLWAELVGWNESGLDTRLISEPVLIKSLTAGKPVHVAEADVVDWMIRRADGSVQGNLTGSPAKEGGTR